VCDRGRGRTRGRSAGADRPSCVRGRRRPVARRAAVDHAGISAHGRGPRSRARRRRSPRPPRGESPGGTGYGERPGRRFDVGRTACVRYLLVARQGGTDTEGHPGGWSRGRHNPSTTTRRSGVRSVVQDRDSGSVVFAKLRGQCGAKILVEFRNVRTARMSGSDGKEALVEFRKAGCAGRRGTRPGTLVDWNRASGREPCEG